MFYASYAGTENRHFYQKQTNFRTGSGSCFKSPMFRMFRKPVSVLDEKNNKTIMWFGIMFQIHLKEMRPWGTTADGDPQGLIVHSIILGNETKTILLWLFTRFIIPEDRLRKDPPLYK